MSKILKGDGGSAERPASTRIESGGRRVIKSEVADARTEAKTIVETARAEANTLIETARAEAETIRKQAHEDGYAHGLAQWTDRVTQAAQAETARLESLRENVTRLAVRIARKILGRELQSSPELIGDLVLQAVRGLQHDGRIQIRVRPQDLEVLKAQRARLVDEIGSSVELDLVPDANIEEGGCRVETPLGIVDARLETQLRVLEKALLEKNSGK